MRLLHALALLATLILGQVEPCRQMYLRDDGTPCPTCPEAPCVAPNFAALAAPAVALEADCKSCCHLAACTSNHGSKAAASSPAHVEVAAVLVEPLPQLVVSTGALVAVSVHVQAFFPNAPPGKSQGRSPPFRLS